MRRTILWFLLLSTSCIAQKSPSAPVTPPPEPNGIVSGRVLCADTGGPARFASVRLMPIHSSQRDGKRAAGTTTTIAVETTLDGSYTLTHIAPGSYYVIVWMNGYISPLSMFSPQQLDHPTDQQRTLIDEAIPRVNVEQDSTAHADVRLQRGASVSGTVTYDDGAPASGINVTMLHKDESGRWVDLNYPDRGPVVTTFVTDDRGHYRLSALLPDTYLLEASLNLSIEKTSITTDNAGRSREMIMSNSKFSLSFYGNGTPYMGQAEPFTLRGDDERTGQDVTIPISKLHRLTGRIAAGPDGHLVNAGYVQLLSASDKKSLAGADVDREDGLFHFEFVPEGTYTLRVTRARDVVWEAPDPASSDASMPPGYPRADKERVVETYGDGETPVILNGDMTGIVVTVPLKNEHKSASSTE